MTTWFLIAGNRDIVARVRSGMSVGETAEGELSFDPSCARVALDLADDGDLLVRAVGDYTLEPAAGRRRRRKRLGRELRARIRLCHQVLELDTDFAPSVQQDDAVTIRVVRPAEITTQSHIVVSRERARIDSVDAAPLRQSAVRSRSHSTRHRLIFAASAAALGGLLAIGVSLLSPAHREASIAVPSVSAVPPTPQMVPAAGVGQSDPGGDAVASAELVTSTPLARPAASPARPIEPVALPPVSPRPVAEAARPEEVAKAARPEEVAEAGNISQSVDAPPDPVVVAELEKIGEAVESLATELARRRDLLAADLAVIQGRLMPPAEGDAYSLYNRVLTLDPDSSEASSGLQSVRQQLINRALAQLAGGALDDARRSLQAAADAGADPMLIADLRSEVDYRQERISASSS